jgi:hypothetical protein
MTRTAENVASLTRRRHWTVRDGKATFAPLEGGWRATVVELSEPTGAGRFHVAIVDRTGATRFASEAAELTEAVDRAERGVAARNALRLVGHD